MLIAYLVRETLLQGWTFTDAKSCAMAIGSLAMISTAPDTTHYNQWAYQACTNRRYRTNETEANSRTCAAQVAESCQEGRLIGRTLFQIFKPAFIQAGDLIPACYAETLLLAASKKHLSVKQ